MEYKHMEQFLGKHIFSDKKDQSIMSKSVDLIVCELSLCVLSLSFLTFSFFSLFMNWCYVLVTQKERFLSPSVILFGFYFEFGSAVREEPHCPNFSSAKRSFLNRLCHTHTIFMKHN